MPAFSLLNVGYGGDRVASTIPLIDAGSALIVIDPGMVSSTAVKLHTHRERVLEVATLIVPGHGAPFIPDESTSR